MATIVHHHVSLTFPSPAALPITHEVTRERLIATFAIVTAVLITVGSVGGILFPMYLRETASIAAQSIGQDWANLVMVVPTLILSGWYSARGSLRARFVVGGTFAFVLYCYAIYAFAVHFNGLFLVYCAVLGFSGTGFIAVLASLRASEVADDDDDGIPRRSAAIAQVAIALIFAALWLSDILPALLHGGVPASVAQDNLVTNPVHVIDLSFALPALMTSGILLWRRRPLGYLLSPMLLTLSVQMALAIGGMLVAVKAAGLPADLTVCGVFAVIAVACGWILVKWLRTVPA